MSLGKRLRAERQRLDLTQDALARQCGKTKRQQVKYEQDEQAPGAEYLANAHRLGVDVLYVLAGDSMKEKAAIKLESCPFCGGQPRVVVPAPSDGFATHVRCRCGVQMWGRKHHFASEAAAAEAWNNREADSRKHEGGKPVEVTAIDLERFRSAVDYRYSREVAEFEAGHRNEGQLKWAQEEWRELLDVIGSAPKGRLPDLPVDFSESKDWKAGDYAERVEWLKSMVVSYRQQPRVDGVDPVP